jgi:transposase
MFTNSSWLYVKEVFGWRKIRNRREWASLAGLVPTPYNSGRQERDQGISKAGNRRIRARATRTPRSPGGGCGSNAAGR